MKRFPWLNDIGTAVLLRKILCLLSAVGVLGVLTDCAPSATADRPSVTLSGLAVEYTENPLGIDVKLPRFSWRMEAPKNVRGIQRNVESPGFKHFILKPEPDPTGKIIRAEGFYDSMYGRIESAWEISEGALTYCAKVPANTTATLYLPVAPESMVIESGTPVAEAEGVEFLKYENGRAVYRLTSGDYEFHGL